MNTTRKIAIGIGITGGALLAAWLLTGDRKKKTRDFIVKKTKDLKGSLSNLKRKKEVMDDDIHYV
jgi:hypothetical protein